MHFSAIHAGSTVSPFLAPRLAFRLSWHPGDMALFRHSKSPRAGWMSAVYRRYSTPNRNAIVINMINTNLAVFKILIFRNK